MNRLWGVLPGMVMVSYMLLGLFQLAAVIAGLEDWVGLNFVFAILLGVPIAYIPIVGTVVGMFGAVTAWSWTWSEAAALYLGPFVVILALSLTIGFFDRRAGR